MHWAYRWRLLFHPDSPGQRVVVPVRWPRYLWQKGLLDEQGRPTQFATAGQVLRVYRLNGRPGSNLSE